MRDFVSGHQKGQGIGLKTDAGEGETVIKAVASYRLSQTLDLPT